MSLLDRQIAALDTVIKDRWEPRTKGERGSDECACCVAFDNCVRCPIAEDGHLQCDNTPYWDWGDLRDTEAAQAELDYLTDLRARLSAG